MVETDRGDNRHQRLFNNIGSVQPPAETHFQETHISRGFGKRQEGGCGGHLEKGNRLAIIGRLDPAQNIHQIIFPDQVAGNPDPFAERNQMGRGIDMNPETGGLQNSPQKSHYRSLAVGPGDMNNQGQFPLRVCQMFQQPLKAAQ